MLTRSAAACWVLVFSLDFGWHNIGWRNPEIVSPHLDGLAASGIKLDRHYVFKYCSPTRSSLLTGRLPLHVNQNNEANDIESRSGIDIRMTLLPAKMKQAGYATAMTGKGHLGARTPANLMINRGFDRCAPPQFDPTWLWSLLVTHFM